MENPDMRRLLVAAFALALAACDSKAPDPKASTSNPAPAVGAPAALDVPKGELTYHFGASDSQTTIRFESKTSVTNILGKSTRIEGSATVNWDAGSGACDLKVPSLSLRTGMDDRDRAVLGKVWLDAKQFPYIEFKSAKATRLKPTLFKLDGEFTMHGKTNPLSVEAEVKPVPVELAELLGPGQWVRVKTEFKIKFTDFGMTLTPQYKGVVEEEWSVAIQIFGSTTKPGQLAAVENPLEVEEVKAMPRIKDLDPAGLDGQKYKFGKKPQLSTLTATSETEIENVTAQTYGVTGWLGLDAAKGTGKVRLKAPVAYLKTGIALRDEKLQGADWLNMAKNPDILFESTKATKKSEKAWTIEGTFSLNGVAKPVTLDVESWEVPLEMVKASKWGDVPGIGFRGEFKVKLSDYGVKIPAQSVGKVNDTWTIKFSLIGLQEE
jgi:polyisoprenoid-binding protein YceI